MYKYQVLLVEDNNQIAEALKKRLRLFVSQSAGELISCTLSKLINHSTEIPSVIILSLPTSDIETEQTLQTLTRYFSFQSVIIIAEREQQPIALQAIADGAQDYLILEELNERSLNKSINCALARNNVNYKKIFDESPAAMFIYDKDSFRFLTVNQACRVQYGYNGDEFLQMTTEQIRPEEEVLLFRNISEMAPEEHHDYGRWKHQKKNGNIFTVNIYAHDIKFDGKNARLITAVDVSDTVQAEQQLHDKNWEVSNILESITDGFFTLNQSGEFIYVNKECERMFGLSRGKMIGRNIRDVYDRDEYAVFYSRYRQAAEKATNMRFEGFVSAIGKWISVTAYPTKDGLAVYLVDITERRQIREKLYNDQQQLSAIINNTNDIIWLLNQEGKIIVRNDAFRQWMQHLVEDADAHELPPSIDASWKEHFDIAFSGQSVSFTAMETKGSELFYREVCLNPVRNAAGEVISISCFARDVTQQQLRIHKIQLQNEYLEKIAWMHSHEARGPVANILGLASLFDITDPGDPDNKMMMELIIESSQQLDKVIRKIVADIDAYQLNYGDED